MDTFSARGSGGAAPSAMPMCRSAAPAPKSTTCCARPPPPACAPSFAPLMEMEERCEKREERKCEQKEELLLADDLFDTTAIFKRSATKDKKKSAKEAAPKLVDAKELQVGDPVDVTNVDSGVEDILENSWSVFFRRNK